MTALVIVTIFVAILAVGLWVVVGRIGEYGKHIEVAVAGAIVCTIATIFLGAAIATVAQDNYSEETNRICQERGGVVTKDNHCFVDNHPVEFSPGVWQR